MDAGTPQLTAEALPGTSSSSSRPIDPADNLKDTHGILNSLKSGEFNAEKWNLMLGDSCPLYVVSGGLTYRLVRFALISDSTIEIHLRQELYDGPRYTVCKARWDAASEQWSEVPDRFLEFFENLDNPWNKESPGFIKVLVDDYDDEPILVDLNPDLEPEALPYTYAFNGRYPLDRSLVKSILPSKPEPSERIVEIFSNRRQRVVVFPKDRESDIEELFPRLPDRSLVYSQCLNRQKFEAFTNGKYCKYAIIPEVQTIFVENLLECKEIIPNLLSSEFHLLIAHGSGIEEWLQSDSILYLSESDCKEIEWEIWNKVCGQVVDEEMNVPIIERTE